MEKVFEIYIKTSPERLWEAITDPDMRAQYTFGVRTESDWKVGSGYQAVHPGAGITILRTAWCRASTRSGATTSRLRVRRG
jgi:hypothetical protein